MQIATIRQLTRFEQSLFGLPFVMAGAVLPFVMQLSPLQLQWKWLWIVLAFMAARVSGMAFNQSIDRYIDAENPRTKMRLLPSRVVTPTTAYVIAWGGLFFFLFFCFLINSLTFLFGIVASVLLFSYSYMKRVTVFCHFILGVIHFLGSLMSWIAITGQIHLAPLLLAFVNMTLIVGMDIVYAVQDVEFDRQKGLYSIPVRLGAKRAKRVAQGLHALSICLLFLLGQCCHFRFFYYGSLFVTLLAFLFFHFGTKYLKKMEMRFFYCTLIVSSSTLIFILLG